MDEVLTKNAPAPTRAVGSPSAPAASLAPAVRRLTARRAAERPPSYRWHHYRTLAFFILVVVLAGPWIGGMSKSYQFLVNTWLMYSVAAVGFYWVFSLAGRFAFTQTFMMSLGAYMSAWLTMRGDGNPVILGVLAAMAVGALMALGIFVLLRQAQAIYFGIGTLAVTSIGIYVFSRWPAFTGPGGTRIGVPPLEFFGHEFVDDRKIFWLFLAVLSAVLVVGIWIERAPLRRAAIAGREKPAVAALAGVRVNRNQLALFMLGSAVGALVGALIAHWVGVVAVDTYGIDLGIGLFLMLILGGRQSMWGPVLGAAFYVALPEFIKSISTYQRIVYGVVLLAVIMALPFGLVGLFQRVGGHLDQLWNRVARRAPPATPAASPRAAGAAEKAAADVER